MSKHSPKDLSRTVKRKDASYQAEDGPYLYGAMDTITSAFAPDHPDLDMQHSMLQISNPAKDDEFQQRGRTVGEALSSGFNDINPVGSPTKWAIRNILLNKFGLAKDSKNMKCRQCGSQLSPKRLKEVPVDTEPGFDYKCINNCTNYNPTNKPYGASRRKHR